MALLVKVSHIVGGQIAVGVSCGHQISSHLNQFQDAFFVQVWQLTIFFCLLLAKYH